MPAPSVMIGGREVRVPLLRVGVQRAHAPFLKSLRKNEIEPEDVQPKLAEVLVAAFALEDAGVSLAELDGLTSGELMSLWFKANAWTAEEMGGAPGEVKSP